jgi:hypothetical protein
VRAEEEGKVWSVSPYVGFYQPSLKALNRGEFKAPYEGTAQFIDPVANNSENTFSYDTPLAPFNPATPVGVEFQYRFNDRHSLLIGAANWQATTSTTSTGDFPIQGALEAVDALRKAELSFTEYYLGWRYDLWPRPGTFRLYLAGSLHQLYDINYREDFTGIFLSGDVRQFRKSVTIRARTTGLPLLQGMVGGEWFVADWLSLGLEGGYDLGLKEVTLQGLGATPVVQDFLATDNVQVFPPMRMDVTTRRMIHKSEPGGDYQVTRLDFSGWKVLVKANIYF